MCSKVNALLIKQKINQKKLRVTENLAKEKMLMNLKQIMS